MFKKYFKDYSKIEIALELLAFIVVVGILGYTAIMWKSIPDVIPTHFGADGMPDAYGGRGGIVILAVLCVVVYGSLLLCQHNPQSWNIPFKIIDENRDRVYRIFKTCIIALKLVVTVDFAYLLYCSIKAVPLGAWFLPLMLLIPTAIIIITVYKCKKI